MAASRNRSSSSAADTVAPDTVAPEPEPDTVAPEPVALGRTAQGTRAVKAERVFHDVPGIPRVPMSDGRVLAVQRELRADRTLGAYMLAFVKRSPDGNENAQRVTLSDIQSASDTFGAHGVTLVEPFVAPEPDAG